MRFTKPKASSGSKIEVVKELTLNMTVGTMSSLDNYILIKPKGYNASIIQGKSISTSSDSPTTLLDSSGSTIKIIRISNTVKINATTSQIVARVEKIEEVKVTW